jgi:hypothetical protein
MRSKTIIASSIGFDVADMEDYRYQPTRTKQPIYAVGEHYYACGKRKPTDEVGAEWLIDREQFWAEQNQTIFWSAKSI